MPIPKGWEVRAIVSRLIREGYTDFYSLQRGTIKDIFDMMLLLEWNNYAQAYAENTAKLNR